MTPSPQQEYIITEERLKRFENGGYFDVLLREIRSKPHPSPAPMVINCQCPLRNNPDCVMAIGLNRCNKKTINNQPEGTTCEDCQRFRKGSCPYPGSNITMTMCNAFKMDIVQHDAAIVAATRKEVIEEIWEHIKGHSDPMTDDYFASIRSTPSAPEQEERR